MRSRSIVMVGALLLTGSLASCASGADGGGVAEPGGAPAQTSESAAPTDSADAAALAQAQAWLDAAVLPPGAVRSEAPIDGFGSYTGWPCGPVEELEGFWTIPGATVADTANWLRENPTANLLSTAGGPVPDDGTIDSAMVGYIPERDSQEGIVYTVAKTGDGVAVRAEVAALTESASCPTLPDGGTYGAPGQG
ncbi:hypothetical protein [Microbacterium sp. NPDC087591]|uniref:hypothetical protein n=1 Tax=Microbacterium sp. NPDC087591 TaxID=3364192 RepID=UPI0038172A09